MTKSLFALLLILLLPLEGNAAGKNYYIGGNVGISIPKDKMKKENGYLVENRVDISPYYSLAVGYKATNHLRLDIAYTSMGYFRYKGSVVTPLGQTVTQNEKTKAEVFMFNTYYNFFEDKKSPLIFSPFIGGGIGVAKIRHGDSYITSSNSIGRILMERKQSTNLAFNVIAGVSMPFTDNFLVEWSYKYAYLGNVRANTAKLYVGDASREVLLDTKKYKLGTHNPSIGLRYNF